jgi:hypothetical protein
MRHKNKMKAYGFSRKEKLSCKYGCCSMKKGNKFSNAAKVLQRRARKVARRISKLIIKQQVIEEV